MTNRTGGQMVCNIRELVTWLSLLTNMGGVSAPMQGKHIQYPHTLLLIPSRSDPPTISATVAKGFCRGCCATHNYVLSSR